MLGIFDSRRLNDIAYAHIVGTSHFATLAVKAVFQGLIVEEWLFESVTLAVGPGLFRAGIVGIDRSDRAIDCADSAFYAGFKIIVADILLLECHHGRKN